MKTESYQMPKLFNRLWIGINVVLPLVCLWWILGAKVSMKYDVDHAFLLSHQQEVDILRTELETTENLLWFLFGFTILNAVAFSFNIARLNRLSVTKPTLELSQEEIRRLHQALNEICNGIHISDSEISTRVGATRKELSVLMQRLGQEYDSQSNIVNTGAA